MGRRESGEEGEWGGGRGWEEEWGGGRSRGAEERWKKDFKFLPGRVTKRWPQEAIGRLKRERLSCGLIDRWLHLPEIQLD